MGHTTIDHSRYDPGSFRDPEGRVFYEGKRVCRSISARALEDWEALSATTFFREWVIDGKLIRTRRRLDLSSQAISVEGTRGPWIAVLEHDALPFISYPYEWSFGMLKDAALLQLELMSAALAEDMILKDASPFNVQWRGSYPVFIDIPSVTKLQTGQFWEGYQQFCQLFLYPLMLESYRKVPFQPWLRGSLDGIEPNHFIRLMSLTDHLRKGVFVHGYLQSSLQCRFSRSTRICEDFQNAGFPPKLIERNVNKLTRLIAHLERKDEPSEWTTYAEANTYSSSDAAEKERFALTHLTSRRWKQVWDLGCNTGKFSRFASRSAEHVVAIDADHSTIEALYQSLKQEGCRNILPLVMNLADPSPGLGWREAERRPLSERGDPDLVICLALIHHLVLGASLPMREVIEWLSDLHASILIEFVMPEDPIALALISQRGSSCQEYSLQLFESTLEERFRIQSRLELPGGQRILYFAEPKELEN